MRLDSRKVRWHRDRFGWTLDELADKAGVAKGTLLRAEHGEDIQPRSGRRIAQAFGVDISELVPEMPGVATRPKVSAAPPSPEWALAAPDKEFDNWITTAQTADLHRLWNQLSNYAKDIEDAGQRAHALGRTQKAIDQFFKLNPVEEFVDRRPRESTERKDQETA